MPKPAISLSFEIIVGPNCFSSPIKITIWALWHKDNIQSGSKAWVASSIITIGKLHRAILGSAELFNVDNIIGLEFIILYWYSSIIFLYLSKSSPFNNPYFILFSDNSVIFFNFGFFSMSLAISSLIKSSNELVLSTSSVISFSKDNTLMNFKLSFFK